jgi:rubredoxin
MALKRVTPTRFATYKGTFECETCGRTKKRVVRIESPSISPANSADG